MIVQGEHVISLNHRMAKSSALRVRVPPVSAPVWRASSGRNSSLSRCDLNPCLAENLRYLQLWLAAEH